jgi:short-subunit dehydrogenase
MEKQNETVLITGATSGIGLELARLFAEDGYQLALVAQDEFTLEQVAEELRLKGAKKVTTFAKDLSFPRSGEELYLETTMAGITVDILVNDAGIGHYGKFQETPLEKDYEIIHLNITSLIALTKLYLKPMLERRKGKILQLASVASYQPTPLLAVYAATKSFVLSFTDSLNNELEGTGVCVTALIPDSTETDFFHKADMEYTPAALDDPEDPKVVAKIGYKGLMSGKHHAVAPGVRKQIVKSSVLPNDRIAASVRKQMEEKNEH